MALFPAWPDGNNSHSVARIPQIQVQALVTVRFCYENFLSYSSPTLSDRWSNAPGKCRQTVAPSDNLLPSLPRSGKLLDANKGMVSVQGLYHRIILLQTGHEYTHTAQ